MSLQWDSRIGYNGKSFARHAKVAKITNAERKITLFVVCDFRVYFLRQKISIDLVNYNRTKWYNLQAAVIGHILCNRFLIVIDPSILSITRQWPEAIQDKIELPSVKGASVEILDLIVC